MNKVNQEFDDLRLLTELFGNRELGPDEESDTEAEIEADLRALAYDVEKLDRDMEDLKRKLAGKLAIKRAAEARRAEENTADGPRYPETREELIASIRVMEEAVGYAARQIDEMTDDDLRAHFDALSELSDSEEMGEDASQSNQS